jgi:hypothetical protein
MRCLFLYTLTQGAGMITHEWIQQQFGTVDLNDVRLNQRAFWIAVCCAMLPEGSLPERFGDWASLKAAYRFFDNPKVSHPALQSAHYQEVLKKARRPDGFFLFIQDGSELLFNSHKYTSGLGPTADANGNGLMFHSCLVARYHEGSELSQSETEIIGLSYQKAWIRPETKSDETSLGTQKESEIWLETLEQSGPPQKNWVSVGDRGNDIYDFLRGAINMGWNFVVRARHDRKIEINGTQERLFSWLRQQTSKCKSKIFMKATDKEFAGEVTLEITWAKATVLSPGKTSDESEDVTYIRVWCPERPELEWLLITNLSVENAKDALRIVDIYRKRWLIEDYHKALKTGCRIEDNQLKQAHRILALFGILGVIATKLLSIREFCRLSPTTPVEEVIPQSWIVLTERRLNIKLKTVRDFWRALARLGGFIGRKSDREPGWQTIWKGYRRLQDMLTGANLL